MVGRRAAGRGVAGDLFGRIRYESESGLLRWESETMTDSQFHTRHNKWSGGEKVERGGWAGPSTQEVLWKVEHTGGHTEAAVRAARQKVAEWRSSSENSKHIVFEVDNK